MLGCFDVVGDVFWRFDSKLGPAPPSCRVLWVWKELGARPFPAFVSVNIPDLNVVLFHIHSFFTQTAAWKGVCSIPSHVWRKPALAFAFWHPGYILFAQIPVRPVHLQDAPALLKLPSQTHLRPSGLEGSVYPRLWRWQVAKRRYCSDVQVSCWRFCWIASFWKMLVVGNEMLLS